MIMPPSLTRFLLAFRCFTAHDPDHQIGDVMTRCFHIAKSVAPVSEASQGLACDIMLSVPLKEQEAGELIASKGSQDAYWLLSFQSMVRMSWNEKSKSNAEMAPQSVTHETRSRAQVSQTSTHEVRRIAENGTSQRGPSHFGRELD
jgi:hypothetical protein